MGNYDVARLQGAGLSGPPTSRSFESDSPTTVTLTPGTLSDSCDRPDVEFEQFSIGLEELGELVFRSKDWPMRWEVDVRQVVVPYRIVEN